MREYLIEHPEAVDGVLEGRSEMFYLTDKTYIQWLAYGAIYPSAARDFLLVTSEEVFDRDHGFVIASTSIDTQFGESKSTKKGGKVDLSIMNIFNMPKFMLHS